MRKLDLLGVEAVAKLLKYLAETHEYSVFVDADVYLLWWEKGQRPPLLTKQLMPVYNILGGIRKRERAKHIARALSYLGWGSKPSLFQSWFDAQFGSPPIPESKMAQLKEEREAVTMRYQELEDKFKLQADWEAERRSALYAWQARGTWTHAAAKSLARSKKQSARR